MPDLYSLDVVNTNIGLRLYDVILFKVGSTYYARKHDGTMLSSGTVAETVIQAALNNKGVIYFAGAGTAAWDLSGAFTGFTVDQGTTIKCDVRVTRVSINVPNGFTGVAFKFIASNPSNNLAETVGIEGLTLAEQGTEARNWTAIKFEITADDSLSYSRFSNIHIYGASVGIELECSSTQWIESNLFENITMFSCRTGVLFDLQSGSIHRNEFNKINVICAGNSFCLNGFKNIDGKGNMFIGCDVWDIPTTSSEANIKSTAQGTVIIGGMMTGDVGTFEDLGDGTLVVDKNYKAAAGLNVITRPDAAKFGFWSAANATAGTGTLDGFLSAIAVGTGTDTGGTLDSTGRYRTYDTGATINSLTGLRANTAFCNRLLRGYFKTAIYLNSVSNVRVFAGLTSSTSAPASASDALNALSGVGLWFDSAVSANWKMMHNDGSGASTTVDTTVAAATATLYPVEIVAVNDARWHFVFNGVTTNITTDMPASTTSLCFWVYMENTTGASRTMRHYYVTVRNDK